jgi:lysyl-tRNA synthetase class 2
MALSRLEEIRQIRLEKLSKLKSLGINPYPAKYSRDFIPISHSLSLAGQQVSVVGRLVRFREHGNIIFADLKDSSGQIQLFFQKKELEDSFAILKLLDIGDFLGVAGEVITTQAGEITISVKTFELLSKSIRPLPDDWHGLKDEEERYRRRYVDLQLNDELRDLFRRKGLFWNSMREFLLGHDFQEVETPVLENVFGGADATPFITHHNALDIDLYLRISMGELWQKRLMVGGFQKTFEIGRQFRNEGLSREHLQDYTQMEFYWSYANFEDSMNLVEEMYKYVASKTFGRLQFSISGHDIDLEKPWARIDYAQTVKDQTGFDIRGCTAEDLRSKLSEMHIPFSKNDDKGRLIDLLWKSVRKNIAGPAFLIGHPVEVSPLAKRSSANPDYVERYQVILAGSEMGNGYSELNDPIDQAERFKLQQAMRDQGDAEAQMYDHDFVEALEFGMPPVTGFGVSERLFSFLADKPIRETVLFPLLRPDEQTREVKQDFDHKIAIFIDSEIPGWQIMNTSGHIAAFLGNKMTSDFDTGKNFLSKDGLSLPRNSQHPIVTLKAGKAELKYLLERVRNSGLLYIAYVPEMMETSDDKKLAHLLSQKTDAEMDYAGIGIFGPKEQVEELTKGFSLWE